MTQFNWDQYETAHEEKGNSFNFDDYPSEAQEPSFLDSAKEKAAQFGEQTLADLPGLGAGAGGTVGLAVGGPVGGLVGAGVGGYTGKAAQNLINRYHHPERAPKEESEYLTEPLESGIDGMTGEAIGGAVAKAIGKSYNSGKGLLKKFGTTLGPSEEAINARLAGRAQDNAKNYPKLAEDLAEVHRNLGKETGKLDQEASQVLRTQNTIPKDTATQPLDREIKNVTADLGTAVGEEDREIVRVLDNFKKDIEKVASHLSEKQLKAILKRYDKAINWEDQTRDQLNRTLKGLRHELDQYLKAGNKAYEGKMKEVSKRADVLENIRQKFNLRNKPGEGIRPTDTTVTKIQTSPRENKSVTQEDLEKLEKLTGRNFENEADDYRLAQQFEKTAPQGAKRTVTGVAGGALVGTVLAPGVGSLLGGGIGGLVGSTLDRYGGRVVANIIDTYRKYGNYKVFGPYAGSVKQAVERGPKALEVLGAILAEDPDFNALLEKENSLEQVQ